MLLNDLEGHLTSFGTYSQDGVVYTVRKDEVPDTPDAVIVVLEFPAGKGIYAMGPSLRGPVRERVGLQLIVRGPQRDYGNTRAMAEIVHQRLDTFKGMLAGRRYTIHALHPPVRQEQDRNARWKIESNFLVLKERG